MIPSPTFTMTDGQIDKLRDLFVAVLNKHRFEFNSEPMQIALGNEGLPIALLKVVREYIENETETIVRHFKVDRTRTRQQMLDDTGRKQCSVNKDVLATMPTDGPEEGDLYFFRFKRFVSVTDVATEFKYRGFVPDPVAQMQINAEDPVFADEYPNVVQWGMNNCILFGRWDGSRGLHVIQTNNGWMDHWWFAGVRKNQ